MVETLSAEKFLKFLSRIMSRADGEEYEKHEARRSEKTISYEEFGRRASTDFKQENENFPENESIEFLDTKEDRIRSSYDYTKEHCTGDEKHTTGGLP